MIRAPDVGPCVIWMPTRKRPLRQRLRRILAALVEFAGYFE